MDVQNVRQTLVIVQERLRSYVDIEIEEHKVLYSNLDDFSRYVYEYLQNDFAKFKIAVKERYSQEGILHYVELLKHNRKYIELRYSSEEQVPHSKIISDLTELLQRFFENDLLYIDEDCFYIILESYPMIQEWVKSYVRNYSIIIAHYICEVH
jgi:hypothetical protein